MSKRFLILGGAGMIGRHLKRYLISLGHQVRVYDVAQSKHHDLRHVEQDTYARLELERYARNVDFVFFLAWDVGGSKYLSQQQRSYDFLQNNMRIMVNTFEFLKHAQVPFLFTSSQMAAMLHSSYGSLKRVGEQYTESLGGLNVRLWNVYGSETIGLRSHVINDFIDMASTSGIIQMRTDGNEQRQFLFVEDCCKALLTLANTHATILSGKPLHITSFTWSSIKDIASVVQKYYDCTARAGRGKDATQLGNLIEPDRSILELWQPETTLRKGIQRIIDEYENRKTNSIPESATVGDC